jgi:glycosyltransferase involved in cell wall biosynthesis
VFLGRISPEKRPDRAIEIALAAGMPLRIAAKVSAADEVYWRTKIEPLIAAHPSVTYLGEIADQEKPALLGGAAALLFPIDWPEPFGLVMIEAMACGTPVIAWPRGSVPEVIDDGATGFLVESVAEAAAAVHRLPQLDRRAIRATFERRFEAGRMARDYLAAYTSVIGTFRSPEDVVLLRA